MARIRSIHPGLYTDDAFMMLSMGARMLLIGLWSHADDGGGFEWKPVVLKARVFPADNIDVTDLLEELVRNDVIQKYDFGDRSYGAVRNFGKWQRPKKPSRFVPMPEPVRNYCASKDICADTVPELVPAECGTSTEPVPNQYGNSSAEGRKVGRDLPLTTFEDAAPPSSQDQAQTEIARIDAAAPRPVDARDQLWTHGTQIVQHSTGLPVKRAKSLIGKWLRDCGDSAETLNAILDEAVSLRPAVFQEWVTKAIQHRMQTGFRQIEDQWGLTGYDIDANAKRFEEMGQ